MGGKRNMRTTSKRNLIFVCMLALVFMFSVIGLANVTKASAEVDFRIENGASIRISDPDGIRFRASVNEVPNDATFGALVLPQWMMGEKPLELGNYKDAMHFENMEGVLSDNGRYNFNVVIAGIPVSEYDTELVVNFYMTQNGVTTYTNQLVRSAKQVADIVTNTESESLSVKDSVAKYTFNYNANYLVGTIEGQDLSAPINQNYRFVDNAISGVYLTAGDTVSVFNPETYNSFENYQVVEELVDVAVANDGKVSVNLDGLYTFSIDGETVKVTAFTANVNAPIVRLASDDNVFLVGTGETKYYTVKSFDNQFVIKNGDSELVKDTDYRVNGETIALNATYLKTLEKGETTLKVVNDNGEASFVVKGVNAPYAKDGSQNVTKFTNEVISNEKLRVSADDGCSLVDFTMVGVKVYDYDSEESVDGVIENENTVSGSFGKIIIDDANKNFDFERTNGWFGKMEFTYIATDNYGYQSAPITMDVVYKELAPTIGEKDEKVYYKAKGNEGDITFTITNANVDDTVIAITNGDYKLVEDVDYTVGARSDNYKYFTVKASYLNTLSYGDAILTLYTGKGNETMNIKIVDKLVASVESVSVDKANVENQVVTLIGGYPFVVEANEMADFNAETGELTIKASYLETLSYGETEIKFTNGYGKMAIIVNVRDSRKPILNSEELNFVSGSNVGVNVQFTMYDKTFVALYNGENEVDAVNYSFENGILTVKGEYINQVASDLSELALSAKMSDNTIVNFMITIESASSNPTVTNLTAFEIDMYTSVTGEVNLDGGNVQALSYNGNNVDSEFWVIENDTLTIKASYLTEIYRFGTSVYAFELSTDKGAASFEVEYLNANNKVLNAGFETGNLYGWNSYQIWKNESGMVAWTNDRVVNGGYFDQGYSYNKDGEYNLGIYGGNISKDSGQERMGHLRSSDFVLGGSGYISFKLGGGQNEDFAYVSVRETSTNKEVARFGNTNFNNKELSKTDNAEAFMFKYYFDLSSVGQLNTSYYFTITDASSNNWCVLSADSFYTYYETVPNTEDGTIATNILPNILGVGNATDSFVNGNFDSNSSEGWTQGVNEVLKMEGDYINSNKNGDGDIGVLRSSAFKVSVNAEDNNKSKTFMKFGWAGAIKNDKTLFVSIKEVGTNIEVLRFVRRDNLSGKENGNFDNHVLDLTSLSTEKEYYIELSDNYTGGWGLIRADGFTIITVEEANNITSGDRAVSIGGIVTDYTYVLPYNV